MLQILLWLLPASTRKNTWLCRFGHRIHPRARIGPTLVLNLSRAVVAEGALVRPFNTIRDLGLLSMGRYAEIGSFNWISAHPVFRATDPKAGTLFMGTRAKIGSRNYVDCSGTVALRAFAVVGGNGCLLQTHEPDLEHNRQTVGRITVGHHSLVGSRAVLLKGAALPEMSVLASNSTLLRGAGSEPGCYAGSPAKWRRPECGEYFKRNTYRMPGHDVNEPMGVQPEDLVLSDADVVFDEPT